MPLLKRQNATPALKDAIVLDLADVSRQAERIREQARAQAERIVQDAERRARELTENAEAKGREQGHAAGYAQGVEEGRAQGHAEALEQHKDQLAKLEASWTEAAEAWSQHRQQLEREAHRGVIELAVKLAEKLVHRLVEVDQTVIADQLAAALEHVLRPLDVSVQIHPDDRPLLEQALPDILNRFPHLEHIDLIDDEAVGRGGCVLSFGQGQVDATIDTQLDRIVRALVPGDDARSAEAEAEANSAQADPDTDSDTDSDTGSDTDSAADSAPAAPGVDPETS